VVDEEEEEAFLFLDHEYPKQMPLMITKKMNKMTPRTLTKAKIKATTLTIGAVKRVPSIYLQARRIVVWHAAVIIVMSAGKPTTTVFAGGVAMMVKGIRVKMNRSNEICRLFSAFFKKPKIL
jgi:hypothetical protein